MKIINVSILSYRNRISCRAYTIFFFTILCVSFHGSKVKHGYKVCLARLFLPWKKKKQKPKKEKTTKRKKKEGKGPLQPHFTRIVDFVVSCFACQFLSPASCNHRLQIPFLYHQRLTFIQRIAIHFFPLRYLKKIRHRAIHQLFSRKEEEWPIK